MNLPLRFDYATELRGFAREVEALVLADRRDPEAPIIGKVDLARRMYQRAAEVMRHDDRAERGTFRAETVFGTRRARPVRSEIRGARRVRDDRSAIGPFR
ncbi:hypothetical protein [Methylobacterium aerolatum]|uniref:Uncharacterized protein n=1 Tax=Methylobacterium aerolatum TaxID=418708 RepID=A0ABU0I8N7_9HYPH|nr:hypothetical protein [Methylobacterium aerolatum]MDQ0450041.1 hypothetical protein [Methylobacterium aerolatum]GJD37374.1 hypothetical protein FMGBMHLM_4304 [Methylobacterium aerolatum]